MKWLVIALIALFLIILLIIFTKITIFVHYYHGQDNDQFNIKLKIWFGLITLKRNIPLIKMDKDSQSIVVKESTKIGEDKEKTLKNDKKKFTAEDMINGLQDMKQILKHVVSLHKIIRIFLKKVSLRKLEWHSVIGVGDAALTGTLTGSLWAVKGGLLGLISNYLRLKDMPNLSITPSFQAAYSQTDVSCMIQFRIGHAMMAGLKLVKYWKGEKPKFKTKPLSLLSKGKSKTV